jgi:hypothetical protein
LITSKRVLLHPLYLLRYLSISILRICFLIRYKFPRKLLLRIFLDPFICTFILFPHALHSFCYRFCLVFNRIITLSETLDSFELLFFKLFSLLLFISYFFTFLLLFLKSLIIFVYQCFSNFCLIACWFGEMI